MNGQNVVLNFLTVTLLTMLFWTSAARAQNEFLVKFKDDTFVVSSSVVFAENNNAKVEPILSGWVLIKSPNAKINKDILRTFNADPHIEFTQPNYAVHILENYQIADPLKRSALLKALAHTKNLAANVASTTATPIPDNLPIPKAAGPSAPGADPLLKNQWGMLDIGAPEVWRAQTGNDSIIVAVIDTGVDYTHEDLIPNLWHNPGETGLDAKGQDKATNGVDDDGNGFIDDVVGWDFKSNDNKPYDLTTSWQELLTQGGNPGHGTHCAGNVAAAGNNSKGVSGVAPKAKIMALRFLGEKGGGTTADAIKAIRYAVDNGAKILSNSWGSEGEDPAEGAENKALRDVIQYAEDHGVLFIAAAGNGHNGTGYDNDIDKMPSYPATYENQNIISVAALDSADKLGGFSNWGYKSVDIGAPGVAIFSTTVGSKYNDKVLDVGGFEVFWDGTSMATPHVAGAAALYWSTHPEKTWQDVKDAILKSAKPIPALSRKVTSEGKLDLISLMKY